MNGRQTKKLKKYYRKDLKEQLLAEYSLLKEAIKPKPRFMPRWAYRMLALVYVRKNYRDKLFGK